MVVVRYFITARMLRNLGAVERKSFRIASQTAQEGAVSIIRRAQVRDPQFASMQVTLSAHFAPLALIGDRERQLPRRDV
jgi:hypothetical protein